MKCNYDGLAVVQVSFSLPMSEAARRGLRDTRACVAALMLSDREMQFEEVLEDEGFCARQV